MSSCSILLEGLGKKYGQQWIFRDRQERFDSPERVAVLGANGSGKSTFIQVISGLLSPTLGQVSYVYNKEPIPRGEIFKYISWSSPAMQLEEKLTVNETITDHSSFVGFDNNLSTADVLKIVRLDDHGNKRVEDLSSGMRQRLKVGLCLLSTRPVILLDEPCSNLDAKSVDWYLDMVDKYTYGKLVFVASNDPREYEFCTRSFELSS